VNDRPYNHTDKRIRRGQPIPAGMVRGYSFTPSPEGHKLYKVRDIPFRLAVRGWITEVVGNRKGARKNEFHPNEEDRIRLKIKRTQLKRHIERKARRKQARHA